jgi:acyl transferase domain-containing protein
MSQPDRDIAIIGMACIYPGAPDVESFWSNILSRVDAVSDPPENWRADLFFEPDSTANDRCYVKKGGFIQDFAEFNPFDFGIMPKVVEGGDPGLFLGLRLASEALADARYHDRPFDRQRTGIILGRAADYLNHGIITALQNGIIVDQTLRILRQLHPETCEGDLQRIKQELKASLPPFNPDTATWLIPNLLAGCIANRLNLQGPNFTLDAACASSLIALDLGINELLSHRCDMMIVGGCQTATSCAVFGVFCQLGALSRSGKIRPFGVDNDGTLLSDGIGMMVIRRREDAERDGDHIYALVKGTGVSSDGRGAALLVPRVEGEILALQRAYEASGIATDSVGMIEAHGTGTPVGDVVEIQALTQVFGSRKGDFPTCALGSVKSMIGHSIAGAGIAGLIKSIHALYHKVLPPTLCERPSSNLELEKTPFYLNTEARPWIHGGSTPRRAAVNAFGFGGINAHVILEEYQGTEKVGKQLPMLLHWDTELIVIHAESRGALIAAAEKVFSFAEAVPDTELKDIAYTLNCDSPDFADYRLAIVAKSVEDLKKKLGIALRRLKDDKCRRIKDRSGIFFFEEPLFKIGKIAFMFPGEGSQYPRMLSELCIHFPEAREPFDLADQAFAKGGQNPLPSQLVYPDPFLSPQSRAFSEQLLWNIEYAIITVSAANLGMLALFERLQIRPNVMVGHSIGENIASLASGVTVRQSNDQLCEYCLEINKIQQGLEEKVPAAKLMMVGAAEPAAILSTIAESNGQLHLALDNCPNQVVLCGSEEAIEAAQETFTRKGAICSLLPIDRPYHTPWYRPISQRAARFVESLDIQVPPLDVYSCVTAQPFPKTIEGIRTLLVEQWANPVRFRETIEAMYADGVRIFVEVGPKGNLTSFVEDTLGRRNYVAVASNGTNMSDITHLNHMLGLLAAHGVPMKLDHLYARRKSRRLPILQDDCDLHEKAGLRRPSPGTLKLDLCLPMLSLEENAGDVLGETEDTSLQNSLPEQVCLPLATPHGSPEASTERMNGPVRPKDSRSEVVMGYFQTMEQFLSVQEQIFKALMKKSPFRQEANIDKEAAERDS